VGQGRHQPFDPGNIEVKLLCDLERVQLILTERIKNPC
jgi:hypothetical protein